MSRRDTIGSGKQETAMLTSSPARLLQFAIDSGGGFGREGGRVSDDVASEQGGPVVWQLQQVGARVRLANRNDIINEVEHYYY